MSAPLTRAERDALLADAAALEQQLYPPGEDDPGPEGPARVKLLDAYYQVLHEYGDRLPRMAVGRCPHTKQVLKRVFDPFGLDGPFWHKSCIVEIEEPAAPPTFKVLLGALDLHGREPVEARAEVIPGPDMPFVVPRLLGLPGMKAVVSQHTLETNDTAYLVSYFSGESIPAQKLHQHWLRQDLWFPNDSGGTSWLTKNDPWDFDLARWIESGQLAWIEPGDPDLRLQDRGSAAKCPFLGRSGDPHPKTLTGGKVVLMPMPDAMIVDPFQ